ncbi:MAG: LON peptidase substrate-binding domain-containing protein [Betaproteobacteria bacterium]
MHHTIPLFPLSHGLFPDGMLPLQIFEVRYLDLIKRCHQQQLPFGVAWIKEGSEVQVPGQVPSLHQVGCMAHIREFEQVQPNFYRALCQGGLRFELHDVQPGPYGVWQGSVSYVPQDPEVELPATHQTHADRLGKVIASAQKQGVIDKLPIFAPYHLDQCGWLANRYAEAIPVSVLNKQQLLSELDPLKRLEQVNQLMQDL